MTQSPPPSAWRHRLLPWRHPSWRWAAPAPALAVVLYYLIGGWIVSVIDADPEFGPGAVTARQSRAVAVAAALIHREVDVHHWVANDPFFQPGWVLDDMPAYQQGIIAAIRRFTTGLVERQGDSGVGADGELAGAAGLLKYPATVWKFDLSTSLMPTASTEKQYRRAGRSLDSYNQHIEQGSLAFDRRPEAVAAAIADIGRDLAGQADLIAAHLAENHWAPIGGRTDALFYSTKGKLYAYSLLLREFGWDYAQAIGDRGAGAAWRHMLETIRTAAGMQPLIVVNGAADNALLASHLAAQGFHLLRARQELADLAAVLARPVPAAGG